MSLNEWKIRMEDGGRKMKGERWCMDYERRGTMQIASSHIPLLDQNTPRGRVGLHIHCKGPVLQ